MRTVLITGSSRGIGFGIAKAFAAQESFNIVLNCRQDEIQLESAICEIKKIYPSTNIIGICADIADYEACQSMFLQVEAVFGKVDVLINNAGTQYFGLFSDMTLKDINQIINSNLNTVINASHISIPNMVRAKSGVIINITSVWGISGASCEAVYASAKAAVVGLTKSLAKELAPSGIRVNAIACGAFNTRMNDRLEDSERAAFEENIPMGRFGLPSEAGGLAVYLASDEAASYLTGQVIALDGGLL